MTYFKSDFSIFSSSYEEDSNEPLWYADLLESCSDDEVSVEGDSSEAPLLMFETYLNPAYYDEDPITGELTIPEASGELFRMSPFCYDPAVFEITDPMIKLSVNSVVSHKRRDAAVSYFLL
jgi:hypothetical protein